MIWVSFPLTLHHQRLSLLMCHGESPQQHIREGYLGKGSSQNQKYLNASSSSISISTTGETHRGPTAKAGAVPEAETGSCGVSFPASELTLPKTEQLIIHTYRPMVHSCTAHCFLLGVGALLGALLPYSVYRTDSIYLSLFLEMNSCCHWLQQNISVTIHCLVWRWTHIFSQLNII